MMDLQRSYFFAVFTVMLIHEMVFSECDLKTKTHSDLIKSYVDGFQRRERQAPIDPSRMYLPPKIDSVASSGFGDSSSNFGGNADANYRGAGLVQDTRATTEYDGSSYGVPTKTATDDGFQGGVPATTGGGGDDSYGLLSGDRNDFGRQSNANNGYNSGQNAAKTGENYDDGSSLSSSIISNNNNNNYNTGVPGGGGANGRDELLNTAQSRGPTNNNNSDKSTSGAGGAELGPQNGGANNGQYGGVAAGSGYGDAGSSRGGNSYGGEDVSSNKGRGYSSGGGGNTVPNSFNRKLPAEGSSYGGGQYGNTAAYAQQLIGDDPGSNSNLDKPSISTDFEKQENVIQNANNNGGDFGEPGPNAFSNFAPGNQLDNSAPSAAVKPPIDPSKSTNGENVGGNQNQWSSGYSQTAAGGYSPAEASSAAYGPSSPGDGFDRGGSSNQSPPQGYNSYGLSESRFQTENYYGQISPDSSSNTYNPSTSSTSSLGGFNADQQNRQPSNIYGQPAPQTLKNGRNSDQGYSSNVPSANGAGYNKQLPSNGPSGLDQNQPVTLQTNNAYGTTESQPSSASSGNGYGQRSSTYDRNNRGGPNGYVDVQTLPSVGENYNGQNLPTNIGYTQEGPPPSPTSASRRNNFAQIDTPRNSLPTRSSGQGSSSSSSIIGRPCNSLGGENIGKNGLFSTSTIPGTNSHNEIHNKKKYSTIVPKGQYQNSNLPSSTSFQKQGNGIQNANNNGNFGEPGLNAFSNFAPGNQPNPPISKNNNNCNANNQGNNGNTQYELDFSGLNTGY